MEIPNLRKNKTSKIRVGVLRGGSSDLHDASIKTGTNILMNMPDKYHPLDIFIDRKGKWNLNGITYKPEKILKHLDIIFNGLHGEYGEDGKLQRYLESHKIPYTGSDHHSSYLAINKILSKKFLEREGVRTPRGVGLRKEDANYLKIFEIFNDFKKPFIIKPSSSGSSLGISIVYDIEDLTEAVNNALNYSSSILVEDLIIGRKFSCNFIDKFGPLKPIEDLDDGYNNKEKVSFDKLKEMQSLAQRVHKIMNLKHYSNTKMILGNDNQIYVLDVNTLPRIDNDSSLNKTLNIYGTNLNDFIDHIIMLTLKQR